MNDEQVLLSDLVISLLEVISSRLATMPNGSLINLIISPVIENNKPLPKGRNRFTVTATAYPTIENVQLTGYFQAKAQKSRRRANRKLKLITK